MWLIIFIATLGVGGLIGGSIAIFRNRELLWPKEEHPAQ
jgi:hypothetical protein